MTPNQAFAAAFAIVWRDENGGTAIVATDNRLDIGGFTRGGVALNRHPELTREKLLAMTLPDFQAFYRANYWAPNNCDRLPWPVCLVVFSGEVNSGGEGAMALQAALGITQDGIVGPITLAAVAKINPVDLALWTSVRRDGFYRALANFSTFGQGWVKRLMSDLYAAGQASP